jgi:hypothetical protein
MAGPFSFSGLIPWFVSLAAAAAACFGIDGSDAAYVVAGQ